MRCLNCGYKIPLKVIYLYPYFGLYQEYKCAKCGKKFFTKLHYIIYLCYILVIGLIYLIFGLWLNAGLGFVIMLLCSIPINGLYFNVLMWVEQRSRKK